MEGAVCLRVKSTPPGSRHTCSQVEAGAARASATKVEAPGNSQGNCVAASPNAGAFTSIAPSIVRNSSV